MKVEVRPIPVERWHGKKDRESFTQAKVVEVLYDSETAAYATGLTDAQEEEYGVKLGVDLSKKFISNVAHPYYSEKGAWIPLQNMTMIFETSKPTDFVKVANMKASKFVANSQKEYDEGHWPEATHVIYSEEEEVEVKATKIEIRKKCYSWLEKMTADDKTGIIQILSNKSLKGRSDNFINVEIDDIIENKPTEFLRYVKMGKEEVYVRSSVLRCIDKQILSREAGSIFYMGERVGVDMDAAVEWFKLPENNKMRLSIFEKLVS